MKPDKIIVLRHGQSEGNIDREIYARVPDHRIELTPTGHAQALLAANEIRNLILDGPVALYSSPFARARQTAQPIRDICAVDLYDEDPRIAEQSWGNFREKENTDVIETIRDEYGPFFYRFPEGESVSDVYHRVASFIDSLHRHFRASDFPSNCIIVSHGMAIRAFMMAWFSKSVEEWETWKNPRNCEFHVMEKQVDEKYKLMTQFTLRGPNDRLG